MHFLQTTAGPENVLLNNGVLGAVVVIALGGLVYLMRKVDAITERFIDELKESREQEAKRAIDNAAALVTVSEAMREVKDGFREGMRVLNEQAAARHAEVLRMLASNGVPLGAKSE